MLDMLIDEFEVDRIDLNFAGDDVPARYRAAKAWFDFYSGMGCRCELDGTDMVFYTVAVPAEQAA